MVFDVLLVGRGRMLRVSLRALSLAAISSGVTGGRPKASRTGKAATVSLLYRVHGTRKTHFHLSAPETPH